MYLSALEFGLGVRFLFLPLDRRRERGFADGVLALEERSSHDVSRQAPVSQELRSNITLFPHH